MPGTGPRSPFRVWEAGAGGAKLRRGARPAPSPASAPAIARDEHPPPPEFPLGSRPSPAETLVDVCRMLVGSNSLVELFDRITAGLKLLVPYDALTIYGVDEVRGLIDPLHSVDMWADEIMAAPLELGQGLTGWVIEHGIAENLPAAHTDPRIQVVPGTPPDEREALVSVPLIVRERTIGALNAYRLGEETAFSDEEFDLIRRFADLAALALDNTTIRTALELEAQTDWLTGLRNHRVFHERLRAEIERADRYGRPLSVIVFDLDDFKLLNDVHGHQEGDLVLRRVAAAAGEDLRASDLASRIGGEEFAILLPETGKRAARAAAERLCARVRALPGVRATTVSCGVAAYPADAANATEFLAAADAALYAAKERGKDRAATYTEAVRARRPAAGGGSAEIESMTHLRLLGALAGKLNRLNDVTRIGETIAADLAAMVDYHNARVYLLDADGETLEPVAFLGTSGAYRTETLDALRVKVGEGITGTAAARGQTLNIADADACEFAVEIPGTDAIAESILAVPLVHDRRTIGVIVLSKLGLGQFSNLAARLVELLAAHASVALENARVIAEQRRAAATAKALLDIATAAAHEMSDVGVARRVTAAAAGLTQAAGVAVVVAEDGGHRVLAAQGARGARAVALAVARSAEALPMQVTVRPGADIGAWPVGDAPRPPLVASVAVHGGLLVASGDSFSAADVDALAAIAGQASLALQNVELLAQVPSGYPAALRRSS